MPFSIRVPSLITPVHCITQTEEPISFSSMVYYLLLLGYLVLRYLV